MSTCEIYTTLTLELGQDPEYILDRAAFYEIHALRKNSNKKHKDLWGTPRLISIVVAQCNSRKKLKLDDIVKFPWETQDETTAGNRRAMTQK